MNHAASGAYLRVQTETASPGQLIAMLYDALLRSAARAEAAIAQGKLEEAHASLLRTQDLILELIASLALDADGEAGALARQIAPLYEYVYRRTLDASLRKDAAPLREVVRLITPMRAAWQSVLDCVAQAGPVTTGATRG